MRYVMGFLRFWYDFLVGDSWQVCVGVVVVLACGAASAHWQVIGGRAIGPLVGLGLVIVVLMSFLTTARGGRQ
jgi:hypothetical protein